MSSDELPITAWKQPLEKEGGERILPPVEVCYFFEISPELRLEIYELALPSNKKLKSSCIPGFYRQNLDLLTTCKAMYEEAYPIFISQNNIRVGVHIDFQMTNSTLFCKSLREITVEWFDQNHWRPGDGCQLNWSHLWDLLRYPNVQNIHVRLVPDSSDSPDSPFEAFISRHQEESVVKAFVDHSVLTALLTIPSVRRLTFSHYHFSRQGKKEVDAMRALEKYMSEQLILNPEASHVVPSAKEAPSIIKKAFDIPEGPDLDDIRRLRWRSI